MGMEISLDDKELELHIEQGWLESNPLTDTALSAEIEQWAALGFKFQIKKLEEKKGLSTGKSARSATGT